jgi:hypothetical protein
MNQILDNIQLYRTGSAPDTPAANNSVIFISGSSSELFFKNESGTVYNLSDTSSYVNIYEYTSSGTYTMAGNAKYLQILCIGAGGGGGSGRCELQPPAGGMAGGAGGSGGGIVTVLIPSESFTRNRCNIVVGPGGNGGTGVGPGQSNGLNGGTGTSTVISSGGVTIINAAGGSGGAGGTATANPSGRTTNNFTWQGRGVPYAIPGGNGHNGTTATAGDGNCYTWLVGAPGGGNGAAVGGGYSITQAFSGSIPFVEGVLVSTGSPSITSDGGTGSNGTALFPPARLLNITGSLLNSTLQFALGRGCGTGGSGGGVSINPALITLHAGRGGDGNTYGAGGGGGGPASSSLNVGGTRTSGTGGRGGPGYVLILEYI